MSRTLDENIDKMTVALNEAAWERLDIALTNCRHHADELADGDPWLSRWDQQTFDDLRSELVMVTAIVATLRESR